MLLEEHEKRRFIEYCNQAHESAIMMLRQLRKCPVPDELIQREEAKAKAYACVAADLAAGESFTI